MIPLSRNYIQPCVVTLSTRLREQIAAFYAVLVRPYLEYGIPACSPNLVANINHLERIQRLVTGICHLPCEKKLQW